MQREFCCPARHSRKCRCRGQRQRGPCRAAVLGVFKHRFPAFLSVPASTSAAHSTRASRGAFSSLCATPPTTERGGNHKSRHLEAFVSLVVDWLVRPAPRLLAASADNGNLPVTVVQRRRDDRVVDSLRAPAFTGDQGFMPSFARLPCPSGHGIMVGSLTHVLDIRPELHNGCVQRHCVEPGSPSRTSKKIARGHVFHHCENREPRCSRA